MRKVIAFISILILVFSDQVFKLLTVKYLLPIGSFPLLEGIIRLNYIENSGAAFGSFNNSTFVLIIATSIIMLVGLYFIFIKPFDNLFYYVTAVMIISGGLGNLIDRVFRGYVIDYIEVLFVKFAVFNFADMLVTVGCFLLAFYLVYEIVKDFKKKPEDTVNE